jgi:hypothetical protein
MLAMLKGAYPAGRFGSSNSFSGHIIEILIQNFNFTFRKIRDVKKVGSFVSGNGNSFIYAPSAELSATSIVDGPVLQATTFPSSPT